MTVTSDCECPAVKQAPLSTSDSENRGTQKIYHFGKSCGVNF